MSAGIASQSAGVSHTARRRTASVIREEAKTRDPGDRRGRDQHGEDGRDHAAIPPLEREPEEPDGAGVVGQERDERRRGEQREEGEDTRLRHPGSIPKGLRSPVTS